MLGKSLRLKIGKFRNDWPPKWGCFSNVPRVCGPTFATVKLGSQCHNSSRAVEFHCSKFETWALMPNWQRREHNFQAPVCWISKKWGEKVQWLVRYRNPAISLWENQPRRCRKGHFLTTLYPIFEHAGWSHGVRKSRIPSFGNENGPRVELWAHLRWSEARSVISLLASDHPGSSNFHHFLVNVIFLDKI